MMSLEELLRMTVGGKGDDRAPISHPPDFRVAVQVKTPEHVHFIIHADGHNSETLDFLVKGNDLTPC